MKICETCKTEFSDSTRFCTQCGTELTEKAETVPKQIIHVHKCPSCNLKYQKNTRFCSQCGAELVDVEEEVEEGAENGATTALMPSVSGTNNLGNTKEKTRKKEWKFMGHGITYWIAAVIFAIFMLYFKKTNW